MEFATFLVWRLRTGACGVGAYGFWRFRMLPPKENLNESDGKYIFFKLLVSIVGLKIDWIDLEIVDVNPYIE